ncbi:MAG: Penicillin-binding protein transpeptidase, partial [Frankiales bacterium]|nr:Penicillin-binding protein transpeptidase [Frankiales bacterium]
IALAWGGISGQAGQSLNLVLADYLPARETDLAYASLIEQWGLRAGILAVLAAAVLIWRAAACSRHAAAPIASLAAGGFAVLLATEVSVSVAANLGLLPTAGVPFPLLSSGGSAAAVHIAFAGLVLGQRSQVERHQLWLPPNWRRPHPRLVRATALVLIAGLISMLGVGWQLQHSQGPELRAAGLTQMTRCVTLPAVRGEITDRHGVALALNRPAEDIWTVPKLMSATQLRRLATLTGLSVATIHRLAAASNDGPFVRLVTVSPAQAARINAAQLPGVWVTPAARRYYPYGALLGAMLGWTGVATADDMTRWPDLNLGAIVGRSGLEQEYDPVLRGTDGQLCVYVAANGDPVALSRTVAPVAGSTLRLSIDLGLQQHFASALSTAMRGGADMGSGVMMDPRDGQILAMVSTPSYDDNLYGPPVQGAKLDQVSEQSGAPMLEHNIQVAAPPGSTFKLAVAAANVTHPVLPPDLVIPTGGSYDLLGHTFRNWSVLPPQDLPQAIAWSNDVYFYKLAWGLGPDRIIDTARQLGVGQPTGIDLPGESAGYLGTPATVGQIGATWYPGSTVLMGIGQGYITATPLQDARWTSAVATGGLVTPHLGAVIESGGGRSTPVAWPQPQRLPFAAQLGPVRDGMRQAVTSGTALALGSLPVAAGAKTGTAEDPGAPVTGDDAWMSAVAPIQRPVLEATAFLHGGGGSEPATEPVRAAMAYFFAHQQAIMSTK